MKLKNRSNSILVKSLLLGSIVSTMGVFTPAFAQQTYDFTFTGRGGITASGTIDIVGGLAQSGSISVVNVPLEANPNFTTTATGFLLPASGPTDVRDFDGDVLTYDTVANPLSNPVFDTTNGVAFASSIISGNVSSAPASSDGGTPIYDTIIGLWGISPGSYGMFIGEANPADLNPDGTPIAGAPHNEVQWVYVYTDVGTLTLSSVTPVPEPTTAALFLCALMVGLVAIRRRAAV